MQNNVNEGISLGDIFKAIWKKKILVCIVTVVTLIIVFLGITFGYNPLKVKYSSEFQLYFSGADEGLYPTGEIFNYRDIISKEKLLQTKQSDAKYSKIDIDKIYNSDGIKIVKSEEDSQYPEYIITIEKSGIQDRELMADFVSDLINITIDDITVKSQKTNYVSDLKKFKENVLYSDAITYLIEHLNVISKGYDNLINEYGEFYTVNDITLKSYKADAVKIIKDANLEYYLSLAEKNVYVTSAANEAKYEGYAMARVVSLLRQKEINDLILAGYEATNQPGADFTSEMASVIEENANIIIELKSLCYLTSDPTDNTFKEHDSTLYTIRDGVYNVDFANDVAMVYNEVEKVMEIYETNVRETNLKSILLAYDTNLIVNRSGVFNMIISGVLGVFVGLVLGSIVAMIIELPKLNKKEEKEEA